MKAAFDMRWLWPLLRQTRKEHGIDFENGCGTEAAQRVRVPVVARNFRGIPGQSGFRLTPPCSSAGRDNTASPRVVDARETQW